MISKIKMLIWLQLLTVTAVLVLTLSYNFGATARKGVVSGILYTIEDSSAVIDGQILKEGDTIYDVKVVKIYRTEIEFEKNGERWKQRVRQRPNPAWKESDSD